MTRANRSLFLIFGLGFLIAQPAFVLGQGTPGSAAKMDSTIGMAEHAHATTSLSTSLTVTIDGKAATLSAADLQATPQKSVTVHNAHTKLVLFSAADVESSEHSGDVIVATSVGGKGLGEDGQFKLVASEDKKPQRWVRI